MDSGDAAMYLTDETLGGGTPDLKSKGLGGGPPDIKSQLERFYEQAESYRRSEANYWLDVADALRKLQRAEAHRKTVLAEIAKRLGKVSTR